MPATLTLVSDPSALSGGSTLLIGRRERLQAADMRAYLPEGLDPTWNAMIKRAEPGDTGRLETTHVGEKATRICAGVLPEVCSRHNSPSRAWAIPALVRSGANRGNTNIVLGVEEPAHAFAAVCAVARALPLFSLSSKQVERTVTVIVQAKGGVVEDIAPLQAAADAVRRAADWTDRPASELGVDAFVGLAEQIAARHESVALRVIQGQQLVEEGLGGVWGVGRAAEQAPAMVVLDHLASTEVPGESWVGKGIVYDTGGLSIKSKTGMPGMKTDMAGAAAVLAAFDAAVSLGCRQPISAILCLAENAVGPGATRPDDVLQMYSGKTVEVNNTDAEGRLVLADGVAWVARNRSPSRIIDLATLTGAQSMATGRNMAALFCTDDDLEAAAVRAGRASGDLCHPLPYIPEFHRREFISPIADMKNSVKNRNNAQSSCAGQFIGNHLVGVDFAGPWLHVDMAGPSHSGGRGTGYGVALLLTLVGLGAPL